MASGEQNVTFAPAAGASPDDAKKPSRQQQGEESINSKGEDNNNNSKDTRKSLSNNARTREDALKSFKVPSRYAIQDVLGQGAYGIVVSAKDVERKEMVAIKKIERVFDHDTFTKRTLREIRVLRKLKHENVITLKTIMVTARAKDDFDDLYLVFELMETDLANIIKSPQPLTTRHVQFFIYQILRGLKFLHSAGIIHRDIKPRNLLVNSNCDLKICDMGLARFDSGSVEGAPPMTDYIATRWYRAPEIILQWEGYGKPIDMWSVGCILAELIGRRPIFPGNEADHQITLICDVLGRPEPYLIQRCPHPETIAFLQALPRKPTHPLQIIYGKADLLALEMMTHLLMFDPDKRLTVKQCLEHRYLKPLHWPTDEPDSELLSLTIDFPFDAVPQMGSDQLLSSVVEEVEKHGTFYIDPSLPGARHHHVQQQRQQQQQHDGPQPPSDSPPPISPPPPSHPPVGSPAYSKGKSTSPTKIKKVGSDVPVPSASNGSGMAADASVVCSNKASAKAVAGSKRSPGTKASASASSRSPSRNHATSRTGNADADVHSPALVVHSPIFESSQDSTIPPHTPKSPTTPSNVSMDLGRLGAAIDELRAM